MDFFGEIIGDVIVGAIETCAKHKTIWPIVIVIAVIGIIGTIIYLI